MQSNLLVEPKEYHFCPYALRTVEGESLCNYPGKFSRRVDEEQQLCHAQLIADLRSGKLTEKQASPLFVSPWWIEKQRLLPLNGKNGKDLASGAARDI